MIRYGVLGLVLLFVATPVVAQELKVEGGDVTIVVTPDTVRDTLEVPVPIPCPECPPPPVWECPVGWVCTPPPEPEPEHGFYVSLVQGSVDRPDTVEAGTYFVRFDHPDWIALDLGYDVSRAPDVTRVTVSVGDDTNVERLYPYETMPREKQLAVGQVELRAVVEWVDGTTSEFTEVIEVTNPNLPPDTVPPVVPPDTVPPVPGGAPDSLTLNGELPWTNGWWDGQPFTAALSVYQDSSGRASQWYPYDIVNDCHIYSEPLVTDEINITELTGWKYPPTGGPFMPLYCSGTIPEPDTIPLSTPANLRVEWNDIDSHDHRLIAWDAIPEARQGTNGTGLPANDPAVRGDEVYYLVTEFEVWPPDMLPPDRIWFDTETAMASTQRSFPWDYPGMGEILPDSIRFCVLAEAWDCRNCIGPGGYLCKQYSNQPGQVCAAVSQTACSGVLEVQ